MHQLSQLHFPTSAAFRSWLEQNHDKSPGIWMVFYKKHTGMACIEYHEALEEALCFGWIDSLIKKLDDEQYVRKFTPRKNHKKWSGLNLEIAGKLISEGRMTETGRQKIPDSRLSGTDSPEIKPPEKNTRKELVIPEFILEEFALNEPALQNFNLLPPSCKREYMGWITQAKREETIRKRLKESIEMLKKNRKLGLK